MWIRNCILKYVKYFCKAPKKILLRLPCDKLKQVVFLFLLHYAIATSKRLNGYLINAWFCFSQKKPKQVIKMHCTTHRVVHDMVTYCQYMRRLLIQLLHYCVISKHFKTSIYLFFAPFWSGTPCTHYITSLLTCKTVVESVHTLCAIKVSS